MKYQLKKRDPLHSTGKKLHFQQVLIDLPYAEVFEKEMEVPAIVESLIEE